MIPGVRKSMFAIAEQCTRMSCHKIRVAPNEQRRDTTLLSVHYGH
jgi:hypothetical protein